MDGVFATFYMLSDVKLKCCADVLFYTLINVQTISLYTC